MLNVPITCFASAAGLAEAVGLVEERLVVAKMQRHLLTKFLTLTFLCYLVGAATLLLWQILPAPILCWCLVFADC